MPHVHERSDGRLTGIDRPTLFGPGHRHTLNASNLPEEGFTSPEIEGEGHTHFDPVLSTDTGPPIESSELEDGRAKHADKDEDKD